MKRCLMLLLPVILLLAGCGQVVSLRIGEAARVTLTSGATGETVEITAPEVIEAITGDIEALSFKRGGSSRHSSGWSYRLRWYDADGAVRKEIVILDGGSISAEGRFWSAAGGTIDTGRLAALLEE